MNSTPSNPRAEQQEIDASAKWPVLVFLGSAVIWLVVGGLLQFAANLQLHRPDFLADCAWTTHGRLAPAAQNVLVYGWGFNAAFAFGLWLMARLSATTLRHGGWLFVGAKFWNLGVTLGVGGILAGYSTSFDLLEMPRFVVFLLLAAYALIGVWGVTTFSIRNTENVYASQWYLFGAAFWFPWLYSIAQVMLLRAPVRGVLQPIVNAWYVNGVYSLWFLPVALAAIYYFLPKVLGKPIRSYYLAPLGFWWFVAASSLAGGSRLIGAPVPVWIPTLGIVAQMLLVLPLVILAMNFLGTLRGSLGAAFASPSLRFITVAIGAFFGSTVLALVLAMRSVSAVTQFTLLDHLRDSLSFYACFSSAMFGAAYFIIPRLTGAGWRSPGLARLHFATTALGVVLLIVAGIAGGLEQGRLLADPAVAFATITGEMRGWHSFNTVALGVIFLGHAAFLVNFALSTCPFTAQRAVPVTIPTPPALTLAKEGHA